MPYEGEQILTPAELIARGLMPPGPLAPVVTSTSPARNEAAIRQALNPPPAPVDAPGALKSGLQGALAASDKALGGARQHIRDKLGVEALPSGARFVADALNPMPGNTAQAAATLATLPVGGGVISGPLKRAAAAGLGGALVETAQGKDPVGAFAKYAAPQAIAEVPFALGRGIANQRAYTAAEAGRIKQSEFNTGFTKALEGADKAAYEKAVAEAESSRAALVKAEQRRAKIGTAEDRMAYDAEVRRLRTQYQQAKQTQQAIFEASRRAHAEQGAALVAGYFDEKVPSWRGLPKDEAGLADRIVGTGQQRIGDTFDAAMKAALDEAKGKRVVLDSADVSALGVESQGSVMPPPGSGPRHFGRGEGRALMPAQEYVDAADLIKAMTGKSSSARIAYRNAAFALDTAGIGDPKVRAEYKSAQALIGFAARSKMIVPGTGGRQFEFSPENALKGLTDLNTVNQLRRRGEGNAVEGVISKATRAIPSKPGPLTPPTMPVRPSPRLPAEVPPVQMPDAPQPRLVPPEPTLPEGFTVRQVPEVIKNHPWATSAVMAGGGHLLGAPPIADAGLAAGGLLGGMALGGKKFATQAPINPLLDLLLRFGAADLGAGMRGLATPQQGAE
jgi:hypothetical protein